MDNYTATEQFYKNGYEVGKKDAAKEILQNIFDPITCGDLGEFCDCGWIFTVEEVNEIFKEYVIEVEK